MDDTAAESLSESREKVYGKDPINAYNAESVEIKEWWERELERFRKGKDIEPYKFKFKDETKHRSEKSTERTNLAVSVEFALMFTDPTDLNGLKALIHLINKAVSAAQGNKKLSKRMKKIYTEVQRLIDLPENRPRVEDVGTWKLLYPDVTFCLNNLIKNIKLNSKSARSVRPGFTEKS